MNAYEKYQYFVQLHNDQVESKRSIKSRHTKGKVHKVKLHNRPQDQSDIEKIKRLLSLKERAYLSLSLSKRPMKNASPGAPNWFDFDTEDMEDEE